MNKAVKVVCISILAALFCLFGSSVLVSAKDYNAYFPLYPYPGTNSGATSVVDVPSGGTWNNAMANAGQNAQPSSMFSTGYYSSFWTRTQYGNRTQDSCLGNWTVYYSSPTSYAGNDIIYNGVTYHVKYPCGFINYYPTTVTIPSGYQTLQSASRCVVYPWPVNYTTSIDGNSVTGGTIESAVIIPGGHELMAITNSYNVGAYTDPSSTFGTSSPFKSSYWANGYSNSSPFLWMAPNDGNSEFGIIDDTRFGCTYTDFPIFCDLYDALYYSVTGIIDHPDHVLYGSGTAVDVTPTPTATPTAIPTVTPIPQITGSVSIDGDVNIGNWPTAAPTPTPIVPIVTDGPTPPGGISSGNGLVDSMIIDDIVPDITPGAYNFDSDVSDALELDDSLLPHKYLQDIVDRNGSIFSRLPLNAIDKISTTQGSDSVPFISFLAGTVKAMTPNDDVAGGYDWDGVPFWFLSVFVAGILVVIVKKCIH